MQAKLTRMYDFGNLLKVGLHMIPFYSLFGLDRFLCTMIQIVTLL